MKFVEVCFPEANEELLIATAYFSVQGYALARKHVPDRACIYFLVGKRDGHLVQKAVLEEIEEQLRKVHREVQSRDLYAAVQDILHRLKERRFRIADARQMIRPFHCKIYIVHEELAWHGSANFSKNGLTGQSEQVTVVLDPVHIRQWRTWFHEVASTARDLNEELIDMLQAWLEMADPFDVYLKALLHLLDVPDLRRERGALPPVYYQKQLAAWAVRQLDVHGGALLVVATGLGKTIVGAEIAGLLHTANGIGHVILLAPRSVHSPWKTQLQGRGVPFDMFDNRLLFNKDSDLDWHQISGLTTLLRAADSQTLILVDEAHFYRNQLLKHRNGESLVIDRLDRAITQGARIVLMTGSAYGTNIQNLDSLLYLLPHRNPGTLEGQGPWRAVSYQQFSTLPPVAVLGYPHVVEMARQRGDVEDGYPYVDLGSGTRQYLPTTLRTQLVTYELPLEGEVAAAFKEHCFDSNRKMPTLGFSDEEGQFTKMTDSVHNVTLKGWLSSPRELSRCIAKNLETEGPLGQPRLMNEGSSDPTLNSQMNLWGEVTHDQHRKARSYQRARGYAPKLSLHVDSRRPLLQSLQQRLAPLQNQPDDKAKQLIAMLEQRRELGPLKVIIFVEHLVTALYLKDVLRTQMRQSRVACTVKSPESLKDRGTRADLLRRFSPVSHGQDVEGSSFDVLICTDADGVGVNLQDADTVVNYDLTTGADRLVQRLGRILRYTPERGRALHVYTFRPACVTRSEANGLVYRQIRDKYERLVGRHDKSSEILRSRILSTDDHPATVRLDGEVDVASLFEAIYPLERKGEEKSLAAHLSVLEGHRQRVEALQHTLHSARYYDGAEPRLVVLIRCGERYHAVVVAPESQHVVSEDALAALSLLACPPDTPRVDVLSITVPEILDAADHAVHCWCARHNENLDGVERVAALYMLPHP